MTNDKISHFGQGVDNHCARQRIDESMTRATDVYHFENDLPISQLPHNDESIMRQSQS